MSGIKIFITDQNLKISKRNLCKSDKKLFHARRDDAQFLTSRALKFRIKKRGKFCISHRENLVAVGFSKAKFGLDLEILKPRNFANISEFCFNDYERKLFARADESEREVVFYKIYTIKEALIKARNLGFWALDKVGLKLENGRALACDEMSKTWSHKSYKIGENAILTVVYKGKF